MSIGGGSITGVRGSRRRRAASAPAAARSVGPRAEKRGIRLTSKTVVMRIAVVSDIPGNRQAFEAVLEEISESDFEELWCLGDLVGYGADPDACVDLARDHAVVCLAGNHD